MWQKIKSFFSRFGTLVGLLIGAIGGVFFATRRTNSDFERLRRDNEKLISRLESAMDELERLGRLNKLSREEVDQLRDDLRNANEQLELAVNASGRIASGVGQLSETNQRLREWVQKYGDTIVSLENND